MGDIFKGNESINNTKERDVQYSILSERVNLWKRIDNDLKNSDIIYFAALLGPCVTSNGLIGTRLGHKNLKKIWR